MPTDPRDEDRTVPRHPRLGEPRPRVPDPGATGSNPAPPVGGPGRVVPRARAIGRPTAAEAELEARLKLPDTAPPGDRAERGPIQLIPYPTSTPDTVQLPPAGRRAPALDEETQQLHFDERTQRLPTEPEKTVARASRAVDPGPLYDEPMAGFLLQLAGLVGLGAALGLALLLALWLVF